jgi:cell division protein FtsL
MTEKERRYGIGYRPATRVTTESKKLTDESIFVPEKEEVVVERRISVPKKNETPEVKTEPKAEIETITGLSVKSKVLLATYMVIAFILSVVVAITGIIIGNSTKTVSALESQVKTASAMVAVQTAQLDELNSDGYVADKASENGMVQTEVDGTIVLIPVGNGETYTSSTNGFDAFCDWFSGVIGG